MSFRDDAAKSELYLVRLWRGGADGAPALRGKLQHVVSGASCYFDGLSSLPEALEKMLEQQAGPLGPYKFGEPHSGMDEETDLEPDDYKEGS